MSDNPAPYWVCNVAHVQFPEPPFMLDGIAVLLGEPEGATASAKSSRPTTFRLPSSWRAEPAHPDQSTFYERYNDISQLVEEFDEAPLDPGLPDPEGNRTGSCGLKMHPL